MAQTKRTRADMRTEEVMVKEDRLGLLQQVASLYYERRWKKFRIANELNISATQVANLLREAQEEGVVRIIVTLPHLRSMEDKLIERFSLKKAIVIPSDNQYEVMRKHLGQAAANYFDEIVRSGSKVALGGGTTLFHMVEALEDKPRKITIVPSMISARGPEILHVDAYVLATMLLMKSNWHVAKAYGVLLPPSASRVTDSVAEANKRLNQEQNEALRNNQVREVYERIKKADFLFTGAADTTLNGPASAEDPYTHASTLASLEWRGLSKKSLVDAGVVGDLNHVFINKEGEQVISPSITLGLETVRQIVKGYPKKQVVLVAGGPYKANILQVVLKHELCSVFITDATTAITLLQAV